MASFVVLAYTVDMTGDAKTIKVRRLYSYGLCSYGLDSGHARRR